MPKTKGARDTTPRKARETPPRLFRDKHQADPDGRTHFTLWGLPNERLALIEHWAEADGVTVATYMRRLVDRHLIEKQIV